MPAESDGVPLLRTPDEWREFGASLRKELPRGAHAAWEPEPDRRDPVDILVEQGRGRIQELLGIRYRRMKKDPFAFYRGAAAIMAADLARTPVSGLISQLCGDCHFLNFGAFSSPEGTPVFDINDFDETLPGPFEWDLKRLATSFVVAAQLNEDSSDKDCHALAARVARSYRVHMRHLATKTPLQIWNDRIDLTGAIADVSPASRRHRLGRQIDEVVALGDDQFGLVADDRHSLRFADKPKLVHRLDEAVWPARAAFKDYAETLESNRRAFLNRFVLTDVVFKVVGVGSVGMFCAIGLLAAGDRSTLLMQIKEAQASVLEPYLGKSDFESHGERVVTGQRLLQAASDVLLGWTRTPIDGRSFYFRRLKDSRLADIGAELDAHPPFYADLCGKALARAHARGGEAAAISGYLGQGEGFDDALARFAMSYADQTAEDWHTFKAALKSGRISAEGSH